MQQIFRTGAILRRSSAFENGIWRLIKLMEYHSKYSAKPALPSILGVVRLSYVGGVPQNTNFDRTTLVELLPDVCDHPVSRFYSTDRPVRRFRTS
jgi:hypothetical protein